jgi:hypothetical protein
MREPERPLNLTQGERELIELCGKDAQQHDIYRDGRQLRFRSDPVSLQLERNLTNLTDLWVQLNTKDSQTRLSLRRFYREIGYSLCGYLDIFREMLDEEEAGQ